MRAHRSIRGTRGLLQALGWLGAIACASSGCAPSPCEARVAWASRDTATCVTCERACRTSAAESPPSGCDGELACVARCPDRSALTCGCIAGCLRAEACRAAVDGVFRCYVDRCAEACR